MAISFTYGVVCKLDVPHTVSYVKRVPAKKKRTTRDASMQETRAALIDSALHLFARDGLDASLDAICEHAGFTRGAFYVHFADRDALLVAAMEKVGATFLARMFDAASAEGDAIPGKKTSALEAAATRFVGAVTSGDYLLMGPGKAQIRFHQLLEACARSTKVRAQYRALVEASLAQITTLARIDRPDLDGTQLGSALLATIIGAQTMAELGVPIDASSLAKTLLTAIRR